MSEKCGRKSRDQWPVLLHMARFESQLVTTHPVHQKVASSSYVFIVYMTQFVSWRHLARVCLSKLVFATTHPFCVIRADIVFNPSNVRSNWQGCINLKLPAQAEATPEANDSLSNVILPYLEDYRKPIHSLFLVEFNTRGCPALNTSSKRQLYWCRGGCEYEDVVQRGDVNMVRVGEGFQKHDTFMLNARRQPKG